MQRRSGLTSIQACVSHVDNVLGMIRTADKGDTVKPYTETEMVDLLDAISTQAFEVGKICESMKAALGVVSAEPLPD